MLVYFFILLNFSWPSFSAPPVDPPNGMIWVEGGVFEMGYKPGRDRGMIFPDELPLRRIEISGFYMARHELSIGEFRAFVKASGYRTDVERANKGEIWNPKKYTWEASPKANWRHDYLGNKFTKSQHNYPVGNLTWYDAIHYCNWRSKKEGYSPVYRLDGDVVYWNRQAKGYRLPTEAEWEYAARGGPLQEELPYPGSAEPRLILPKDEYKTLETYPLGLYKPNVLGLYDLAGNITEWCWDLYQEKAYQEPATKDPIGPSEATYYKTPTGFIKEKGEIRCQRGGGAWSLKEQARVAYRGYGLSKAARPWNGLRLVLDAEA